MHFALSCAYTDVVEGKRGRAVYMGNKRSSKTGDFAELFGARKAADALGIPESEQPKFVAMIQ